jgi:deazaflavin-dependent oxidoreductase (nitroreductase family)
LRGCRRSTKIAGMPSLANRAFVTTLRVHQAIYEHSGGWLGHRLLIRPTLLLRTTGRKTGKRRTNGLVYARDGNRYLVVPSNGGARRPPAWLLNLQAKPDVEFQVGRKRLRATASVIGHDDPDFERVWTHCDDNNGGTFAAYQRKTDREIPVVALTPAPDGSG